MQLTPMLQQYLDIKKIHDDSILFFRLGDFYEMFFEDARIASKVLEITLTSRNPSSDIPMCGIPYHAAEGYINKLVSKGYKVAICEQTGDPKAKGLTKREVVQIVTPGTNLLEASTNANNYMANIHLAGDKIYLAWADISTGECFYSIYSGDDKLQLLKDELYRLNISEVLMPGEHLLSEEIKGFITKSLPQCLINMVSEEPNDVEEIIIQHFAEAYRPQDLQAQVAVAGLLQYLHHTIKGDLSHINNLKYVDMGNCLFIDTYTLRNLEITRNMQDNTKQNTLYDVIDFTKTAMGSRTMRKWLEYPLVNREAINYRLNGVEYLFNDFNLRNNLIEELKSVFDFERLLTRIEIGNATPRDMVALKVSMGVLPSIKDALKNITVPCLKELEQGIKTFKELVELIDKMMVEAPGLSLRDGGFIKDGYHQELDEYRNIAHNSKQLLQAMEEREKASTGIKSLKIGYNKVFGYYLEVRNLNKDLVPDHYIRKQTLANAERFITEELKDFETKILGAQEKIVQLEYNLFQELRATLQKHISDIQITAQNIANLDVLLALAQAAYEYNYVKPTLVDDGSIVIKDGRHPLVERLLHKEVYVPNDTELKTNSQEIMIITGPNMAGKSTYMRQTAMLTLMAQIGSFIPAREARISPVDKIFTRIGASDNLTSGESTFMVEMNEVAHILKHATKNSLIILDEIGRGTSTYDGMSIAKAVIEHIRDKIGAKTLFATHYHELTDLADDGKVKNFCVAVKEKGQEVTFLRRIVPGAADKSYGIHVAKLAGLPSMVIKRAEKILAGLEAGDGNLLQIPHKEINETIETEVVTEHKEVTKELPTIEENTLVKVNKGKEKSLKVAEATATFAKDESPMQNLFTISIASQLRELDLMSMTPLDAMNVLYDLQKQAKEE